MAAQQVSSDVPRKVADAERHSCGGARPLRDEGLDASVLVGRLRGVGAGVPGPVLRMGEANAAGALRYLCFPLPRAPGTEGCAALQHGPERVELSESPRLFRSVGVAMWRGSCCPFAAAASRLWGRL